MVPEEWRAHLQPSRTGGASPSKAGILVVVDLVLLGGVLYPLWEDAAVAGLGVLLIFAVGSQLVGRARWCAALDRWFERRPSRLRAALVASSVLAVLGGLELAAQALTRSGLVRYHTAMETMLPPGSEDWRLAHITADEFREPDPELLWRPVARAPYNRQRFKGPLLAVPKPAGTFRVFCYGDSNTDGPPTDTWAQHLGARLAARGGGRSYEVVNAGVTGYSSHQGLARFRRDAPLYRPDLVLVSFGWNDAASALGAPDREFRPPQAARAALQRFLLRYRWYLVVRGLLPRRAENAAGPRVPLADYSSNLAGFLDIAAENGARVVLLTRPHRASVAELEALLDGEGAAAPNTSIGGTWRGTVPAYNRALLDFAASRGVLAIDVQAAFAEHPEQMSDETHFGADGRARMAELLERALDEADLLPPPS